MSHLTTSVIVVLMAAAFAVVAFTEWLAARARWVAPVGGFVSSELLEPAPYVEAPAPTPAPEWGATSIGDPDEETESDALTVVGAPAVDPWEAHEADGDEVAEPAGQGFFRRRRR